MRVAFFALVFTFVTRARGSPTCVCDTGKVINENEFGGTNKGERHGDEWRFPSCIAPDSTGVTCENGFNIGTQSSAARPNAVPGVINTQCITTGLTGGTLKSGSINSAVSAALKTANDTDPEITGYPSNPTTRTSACCGECKHGYRLQEVFQAPTAGAPEVLVGYICVEQFCANGITNFADPNAIKCECKAGFFRSDWSVTKLGIVDEDPRIIKANTVPGTIKTVEEQGVRSTGAQFGNYLNQGNCIAYDSTAHCFTPDNCNSSVDCSLTDQPYATLCTQCKDGYNLRHVKCDSLGGTLVEFPVGSANVKNKCQVCELADSATSGCADGHVSPG